MKHLLYSILFILIATSCTTKQKDKTESKDSLESSIDMQEHYMLIGTYTSNTESEGIYVYKLNLVDYTADSISMAEVSNPSYITISPDEKIVYSVGENGEEDSYVHSFSFDKDNGELLLLNSQLTHGSAPAYITLNTKGNNVFTANYGGGSISQFNISSDGTLSPLSNLFQFEGKSEDPIRQKQSHIHSVRYSPDGTFLFATDLGADKLYRYKTINSVFEGQSAILQNDSATYPVPSGTGPRHFDFHPNGLYFYLLGELSGEVIVYDYNMGDLKQKQVILADSTHAKGSADIHISPNGRFLYTSHRLQNDGIAIFSIDPIDGTLKKVGYELTGKHPRNFVITPNGNHLLVACKDDNIIQVFEIDKETGLLTNTHQKIEIDSPVCIKLTRLN